MISVVIPLYNKEKAIIGTLNSVLAQTYTDYEVIIVNDGSTDHSQQVVEDYIKSQIVGTATNHKSQIRLVSQPNGGVSSARNRGIQEAQGEFVAFLDGDDLWAPTYLATLHQLISDYPKASLYALGYDKCIGDMLPANMNDGFSYRGYVTHPWNGKLDLWTGSSSSSRADLLAVGGFDERMTHGEDLDMWWRLVLRRQAAVDTRCLAFYRQDSENRAMHRVMPLEKHIPFYMDKFADARAENAEFRKFFDTQMVYRLYPYMFTRKYRKQAQRLAQQLDYSQLKWSMHFRMRCPWLYRLYERLKV